MTQAQRNEEILNKKLERFIALFGRKCEKLLGSIDKNIAKLFAKYAKDHGMTFQEAFEYLTDNERLEFQEDLNSYLEIIQDEEALKSHETLVSALGLRARINRWEFMKASILMDADRFFVELKTESKKLLGEVGSEAFIKKVEEIVSEMPTSKDVKPVIELVDNSSTKTPVEKAVIEGQGVNMNTSTVVGTPESGGASVTIEKTGEEINLLSDRVEGFATTNPDLMAELVEYPWSGSNYSEKIWGECENLEKVLNETLTQGLVTGKPYEQIVEEMSKKLDVEKWKIDRLVRTEAAFLNNQAQLSAYYKAGIKYYEYLARIDERTSEVCKELNGKIFETQKAMAGENFPPMHPYCRSVTKAVFKKPNDKDDKGVKVEVSAGGEKKEFEPIMSGEKLDKVGGNKYNNSGKVKNTGGRQFEAPEYASDEDKEAVKKYNLIKDDDSDIPKIVENVKKYGFTAEDIERIKSHIFKEEHWLTDEYGNPIKKLFDADKSISDAWERITNDPKNIKSSDIILLNHEKTEIEFIKNNEGKIDDKLLQEEAHKYAKSKFDYDDAIGWK